MTAKKTLPTVSLMSKDYTWTRSESTDIKTRFDRIRAELAAKQALPATNVKSLRAKKS
jgi:hypothetical protein